MTRLYGNSCNKGTFLSNRINVRSIQDILDRPSIKKVSGRSRLLIISQSLECFAVVRKWYNKVGPSLERNYNGRIRKMKTFIEELLFLVNRTIIQSQLFGYYFTQNWISWIYGTGLLIKYVRSKKPNIWPPLPLVLILSLVSKLIDVQF